jgi:hypothetical protein
MNDRSGCPCLYTTPCQKDCTCVNPFMSHGCFRCATYGSIEQRQKKAEQLARLIDVVYAPVGESQDSKEELTRDFTKHLEEG